MGEKTIPTEGFSFDSLWHGLLGMCTLIAIAYLFSANRKAISWRLVGIGLSVQILMAIGILKVSFIRRIFEFGGRIFTKLLDFTRLGVKFLLGVGSPSEIAPALSNFAVDILPTVIFFSALTSVLFYLGVIQAIVRFFAKIMTRLLRISGAESLSTVGNIFLGQTESPLMIKAFLERMNKSEILLVMIGGMATVAGGVLAAYIGFLGNGDPTLELFYARHLLTASVMAAPGAVVIAKILYPQTESVSTHVKIDMDDIGSNLLDAISTGTTQGIKLAINVAGMLLVFIALIALINYCLSDIIGNYTGINHWIVAHTAYPSLSLQFVLGYALSPLMWLIGIAKADMALMGQLLGVKIVANEFVGYIELSRLKDVTQAAHLNYEKSIIMATYMLCGFANFASIGIQIGGIGSLAPGQRKTLSEFGLLALVGGSLASLMSATIAGMLIG
ncbi:MAG: nucleoside transporter C-terminal domain-containing protein [Flavobacteriales bacterium]